MLTMSRAGSAEPVGGVSRFQSVINYYRSHPQFTGLPDVLTFFSGDAFNPSLESTVTKGRHMVPFLNKAGTDVACVGVREHVSQGVDGDQECG
jgi:2',3'-cyclic-nucleotide 2'-phosphodiesterase (5'-nucleotidase family)